MAKGKGKWVVAMLAVIAILIAVGIEVADRRAANVSGRQSSTRNEKQDEILQYLKEREPTFEAKLWKEYPYGFMLISGTASSVEHLPLRSTFVDDKIVEVSAEWSDAHFPTNVSPTVNMASLFIPNWSYCIKNGQGKTLSQSRAIVLGQSFQLVEGKRVRSPVILAGQVNWYLEVIDPDPARPVIAIGFKVDDGRELGVKSTVTTTPAVQKIQSNEQ